MPKDLPIAKCECTGEAVELKNFFKVTEGGRFVCYKGRCPGSCSKLLETDEFLPEGHTKWNPLIPKRKHRDRPEVIPSDLEAKLAEERRLRAERESDGKNEVESGTTKGDAG